MRWALTTVLAVAGAAMLLAAARIDATWFELHVALAAYPPVADWVSTPLRLALAASGLTLGAIGYWTGKWAARRKPIEAMTVLLRAALAAVLALGFSELVLRHAGRNAAPWRAHRLEVRLGQPDPRYGWAPVPSRDNALAYDGGVIRYDIDGWGDRAASAVGAPDPARSSVVVAGESIAFGYGVPFDRSFAARLGADLGLQVVNVSCPGYGAGQAYLRLRDALARLEKPKIAVFTFLPVMLFRDAKDSRAHLALGDGRLAVAPGVDGLFSRLLIGDLANELPFMSDARLENSLRVTDAVIGETARAARARGAVPLFLAISIGPKRPFEAHPEAPWLRRFFVDRGVAFALVDIDRTELVAAQLHPGAAAHRRIAEAIEAEVSASLRAGSGG